MATTQSTPGTLTLRHFLREREGQRIRALTEHPSFLAAKRAACTAADTVIERATRGRYGMDLRPDGTICLATRDGSWAPRIYFEPLSTTEPGSLGTVKGF